MGVDIDYLVILLMGFDGLVQGRDDFGGSLMSDYPRLPNPHLPSPHLHPNLHHNQYRYNYIEFLEVGVNYIDQI
jgi:hypothetical protein